MAKTVTELRVFVASSNDVGDERARMAKVVEGVNRVLDGGRLALWRWEHDAIPGLHQDGIQALINPDLDAADLVILIAHNRVGPGTQGEIERTLKRWRAQGRPQLLAYFSNQPSVLDTEVACDDRKQVLRVRAQLEAQGLVAHYADPADFERKAQEHLLLRARGLIGGE